MLAIRCLEGRGELAREPELGDRIADKMSKKSSLKDLALLANFPPRAVLGVPCSEVPGK